MNKKTITITIQYDENEGSILVGKLILAKIYATKDGLLITTIDEEEE